MIDWQKIQKTLPSRVVAILLPMKEHAAYFLDQDASGCGVGFKGLTLDGIKALPCPWVSKMSYVIELSETEIKKRKKRRRKPSRSSKLKR